jgi:hypothetical protein
MDLDLVAEKSCADSDMNVVLCDGGLSNRLNALIFCLVLRSKFGHKWKISWPTNNWCDAEFWALFSTDLPVNKNSILYYKRHEDEFKLLMHENQCNFRADRITLQAQLTSYDDYRSILDAAPQVLYYHSLIPGFVDIQDICNGLSLIALNPKVRDAADLFCRQNSINSAVLGLHIRKTDFGNAVDDDGLFKLASSTPHRYFVCSDDPEVNSRFSLLPNCVVYGKSSFPTKLDGVGGWNSVTTDTEGRVFPFNIYRSEASIVEALMDLLILSRTTLIDTSHSTFLRMAMIFKACKFF